MRCALFLAAMLLSLPAYAAPASPTPMPEKTVARIDSLIATVKGNSVVIQARGAVAGGGWKRAALKPAKSVQAADAHTIVLELVAQPPPPDQAVIPGLLPVSASITQRVRKGMVSVRVVSATNEITTQILK
jgi:hypothetical protein